jgi:hydrogenase maturation protease
MSREGRRRGIVLALGNDLLGDDGAGIAAARLLAGRLPDGVELVEAGFGGFHLLDFLEGCERALILDAVATGKHPPGTILEFTRSDFAPLASSPHYVGLPEVLAVAEMLQLVFPSDLRILGIEVERLDTFGAAFSPAVAAALPAFADRAAAVVAGW